MRHHAGGLLGEPNYALLNLRMSLGWTAQHLSRQSRLFGRIRDSDTPFVGAKQCRRGLFRGLSHQAGALGIELPSREKVLHTDSIISCAAGKLPVDSIGLLDLLHVYFYALA